MPSPFDVALLAADAAQLATFGEPVRVVPRVQIARQAPAADPYRESGTVTGVFSLRGATTNPQNIVEIVDMPAMIWLPKESVDALGYAPEQHDDLHLVDREASPVYRVSYAYPSDDGGVKLHVTRITEPT